MEITSEALQPYCNDHPTAGKKHVALLSEHWWLEISPELGACCTRLAARHQEGWADVLRPLPEGKQDPFSSAAFAMLPFTNRLYGGELYAPDGLHRVANNRDGVAHPVHGVGWMHAWHIDVTDALFLKLSMKHKPNTFWPYSFSATQSWSIKEKLLTWEITLTNEDQDSMPAGIGMHPYFLIDMASQLHITAQDGLLPACEQAPKQWRQVQASDPALPKHAGSAFEIEANHCFRGWDGKASLSRPELGLQLEIRASHALPFFTLYRPKDAPWLCIEPSAHAPGAWGQSLQLPEGLLPLFLKPQQSMNTAMEISIQ